MDLSLEHRSLTLATRGRGLYEITGEVTSFVAESGFREGLLTVYCPHTSASLLIQENADPDVRRDLDSFFARLAPDGDPAYRHRLEGPDDMPAHIRSALTQSSLSLPLVAGRLTLGTWQGIYCYEHRRQPQQRTLILHLLGA